MRSPFVADHHLERKIYRAGGHHQRLIPRLGGRYSSVQPNLPSARGPVTSFLLDRLACPPHRISAPPLVLNDPIGGDDFHLALYLCYELHYRGIPSIDERWEWEPSLLEFRARLEHDFERALRGTIGLTAPDSPSSIPVKVREILDSDEGPSLSQYLERNGTLDEFLEFVVHRSAYQLKEADPHSWGIPRLFGAAKGALVEIQSDEYGGGDSDRMHAELFRRTMDSLGLDSRYGAYLDLLPGITLATVNLISLFGLHRRWRGALVGHLAAFEMTSCEPNRRYGNALRRLGFGRETTLFYDEHVEADALHEALALKDLVGSLVRAEPGLAGDILFGARALIELERRFSERVLGTWSAGRSSLLSRRPASLAV